jgi:hypothetical protein
VTVPKELAEAMDPDGRRLGRKAKSGSSLKLILVDE